MAPRGRTMLGAGRTTRGDTLVEYEMVLIREQGGQLAYEAHPRASRQRSFFHGRSARTRSCSKTFNTIFRSASAIGATAIRCVRG